MSATTTTTTQAGVPAKELFMRAKARRSGKRKKADTTGFEKVLFVFFATLGAVMMLPVLAAALPFLPVIYIAWCFTQYTNKQQDIFLPDSEIGSSAIFDITKRLTLGWSRWFHDIDIVGQENLPKDKGAMLLGFHTTHNADILLVLFMIHQETGRAVRGMVHRTLYACLPWLKHFGLAPGDRTTAIECLRAGHITACIPGGAEEAMRGHENAYTLDWKSASGRERAGFAKAVQAAGVGKAVAIPVFMVNGEEMRFNPLFWAANRSGFTRVFMPLTTRKGLAGQIAFQIAGFVWFSASLLSLPVPAKLTMVVGKPLEFGDGETAEAFAARCRAAMQELIRTHQPDGKQYAPAIRQRFHHVKSG